MFLNPLERILDRFIQQPEWQKYREYIQIIECWQQVVDRQVFQNAKPLYQEREILYVATSSAVWAQELALQRYSLVKKLNSRLNFTIKDIRFSPASWHQKSKQEIVEIPLQEVSKQKSQTETESNIDANMAIESWLNNIPQKSPNLVNCPQCQSLTPQAELTRWQVCRYCIAQKWHHEYRPPT
jgi:predicted nucleic acid-binding Zn ribbon protein